MAMPMPLRTLTLILRGAGMEMTRRRASLIELIIMMMMKTALAALLVLR